VPPRRRPEETEAAAKAALEASKSAQRAAEHAKRAAENALAAATILAAGAEGDKLRAGLAVDQAEAAETKARDTFHDAEQRARDKDRS